MSQSLNTHSVSRQLCAGDVAAEVAAADIDVNVGRQLSVLGSDRRRPPRRGNLGDSPNGTAPPAGIGAKTSTLPSYLEGIEF
jgi:hypothetical protein